MKKLRVAAIDVGTTKVCTIMGDTDRGGNLRIIGVGVAPSQGLHKGLVVNVNEAKESIRQSVRKAEQVAGYKLESAYVGVTGRHITSMNNKGAVAITRGDQVVRPTDLRRVLSVARNVKVPSEQELLHVIPRTYAVDGQEGVLNPAGMHGFRLDVETHIILAAETSVQNLTKCIRGIGVEIEDLIFEPLASAEAVLTEEERQSGVILADIGGGTTDIAIFKDNSIYHTSVLPVAGYQITRDVSAGLGLSFELAEEMKRSMAAQAEAERERRAKIIHANGEFQASQRLADAAAIIAKEPVTLQLRYLQTITEIASEKSTIVIFPLPIDLIKMFLERKSQ